MENTRNLRTEKVLHKFLIKAHTQLLLKRHSLSLSHTQIDFNVSIHARTIKNFTLCVSIAGFTHVPRKITHESPLTPVEEPPAPLVITPLNLLKHLFKVVHTFSRQIT